MARSQPDLLAIKNELTNNPLGLVGYLDLQNPVNDAANASQLNLVRNELQIDREAIPVSEMFVQIDRDEYVALSQGDRDWLNGITISETVNPKSGGEVREGLLQLFGVPTETRANLTAILTESANRIEHMFKNGLLEVGGNVSPSDIANARTA
jgi:hypothetical protein